MSIGRIHHKSYKTKNLIVEDKIEFSSPYYIEYFYMTEIFLSSKDNRLRKMPYNVVMVPVESSRHV